MKRASESENLEEPDSKTPKVSAGSPNQTNTLNAEGAHVTENVIEFSTPECSVDIQEDSESQIAQEGSRYSFTYLSPPPHF